jgi:hypothetical protein
MKNILVLFIMINLALFGEVQVKYSSPKEKNNKEIKKWLVDEDIIKNLVETVNREIKIDDKLTIFIKDGDSAYYDPENHQIIITYNFITEVRERFKNEHKDEGEENWELYTQDAIEHTFYHELGHALIDILDLPVLGKEEDAVDDFGVLMLLFTTENGEERVLSAAELFFLEGEDIEEFLPEDFMDEHSLDDQRGYRSLTLIYGSNPIEYGYIAKELEFNEEQKEVAKEIFDKQKRSWLTVLKPYLKDGTLLDIYSKD